MACYNKVIRQLEQVVVHRQQEVDALEAQRHYFRRRIVAGAAHAHFARLAHGTHAFHKRLLEA